MGPGAAQPGPLCDYHEPATIRLHQLQQLRAAAVVGAGQGAGQPTQRSSSHPLPSSHPGQGPGAHRIFLNTKNANQNFPFPTNENYFCHRTVIKIDEQIKIEIKLYTLFVT